MDKYRALQSFCRVADTRSFAAAAHELGVVPSALSKTIGALEAELNFKLFNRTTRRVSLTEAGERYYISCRRLLEEFEEAEASARQDTGLLKGRLRVGLHPGVNRLVMARLNEFFVNFPDVILDVTMSSTATSFVDDRLDVLVTIGNLPDSSLIAHKIITTRHVLVASPEYLAGAEHPGHPQDLRNNKLIVSGRPDSSTFGRWTFTRGNKTETIFVPVRLVSREGIFMHEAALSGAGIARLAKISIQSHIDDGSLIALLPDWSLGELPVQALTARGRAISAKARAFIEFSRKVIAGVR